MAGVIYCGFPAIDIGGINIWWLDYVLVREADLL